MKELLKEVENVTLKELARANKMFPLFQSPHEAYGVIKEEQEEILNGLRDAAIRAASELCQVAAMAQKGIDSLYQYKTVKGRSNENKK